MQRDMSLHWFHAFENRLNVALVHRSDLGRKPKIRLEHDRQLGWFATLHLGTWFLNIDWITL